LDASDSYFFFFFSLCASVLRCGFYFFCFRSNHMERAPDWGSLPCEMWTHVASFLNAVDLASGMQRVSRRMHSIASHGSLWRRLCVAAGVTPSLPHPSRVGVDADWQRAYMLAWQPFEVAVTVGGEFLDSRTGGVMVARFRLRGVTTVAEVRRLAEELVVRAAAVVESRELGRMWLLRLATKGDRRDYANKMKPSRRGGNLRIRLDMHYPSAVDATPTDPSSCVGGKFEIVHFTLVRRRFPWFSDIQALA
jgi:hypothetical protein